MPTIARFYGMIIKMYFQQREHNPPHFHAIYGEYVGIIDIATLEMLEGDLPAKALMLTREWGRLYQKELLTIWETQDFIALRRSNRQYTSGGKRMFYKIRAVSPLDEYTLLVEFQDTQKKLYDVKPLFVKWPAFEALRQVHGLFQHVKVDTGGYAVVWNDDIDLSCNELYEQGKSINV